MHASIGKMQILDDCMDPARAQALHAVLGRKGPAPEIGDPLPAFWHQIYFWQAVPAEQLGRDGHMKTGGFIPDLGLPRRMWAGGELEFFQPLVTGRPAQKLTRIEKIVPKQGRTGPLAFVTLCHEISQSDALCVRERQDLVYRQDPSENAPQPVVPLAPQGETVRTRHRFDATTLFRYSALTMNGHRIHYDPDYCRAVEGYPGLVVHGPLLAQVLMQMAEEQNRPLARFRFRATSPLFHFEAADFCQNGADFWVRGPDGRQCMEAKAAW